MVLIKHCGLMLRYVQIVTIACWFISVQIAEAAKVISQV